MSCVRIDFTCKILKPGQIEFEARIAFTASGIEIVTHDSGYEGFVTERTICVRRLAADLGFNVNGDS